MAAKFSKVKWGDGLSVTDEGDGVIRVDGGGISVPTGDTIDAVIGALNPDGFWKLNESTGSVAADSSGNGLDLTVDPGLVDPLWGAPAGPPGEQAADFENGVAGSPGSHSGTNSRVSRSWASMNGDFTVGIWAKRNTDASHNLHSPVMGQGNPSRSSGLGWELGFAAFNEGPLFNAPYVALKGAGGVSGLNPVTDADGWKFLAVTQDAAADQMKLYVDGLLQGSASSAAYTPVTSSSPFWIGHDKGLGSNDYLPCHCTLSYAFLVPSVLSGAQLLDVYNSAAFPGGADAGKALLATGLGGTEWDFAVEVDDVRYRGINLGSNLTGTDNGDNTVTIDASGSDGFDPATATSWWFPLFDSDGTAVLDGDGNLIPTLIPL